MPNPAIYGAASLKVLAKVADEIGWELDSLQRRLQLIAQTGDHETLADIFPPLQEAIDLLATMEGYLAQTAHDLEEGRLP
jgi:hypothetical protein